MVNVSEVAGLRTLLWNMMMVAVLIHLCGLENSGTKTSMMRDVMLLMHSKQETALSVIEWLRLSDTRFLRWGVTNSTEGSFNYFFLNALGFVLFFSKSFLHNFKPKFAFLHSFHAPVFVFMPPLWAFDEYLCNQRIYNIFLHYYQELFE